MPVCPICRSNASTQFRDTPYHVCLNCDLWFQWPAPPKLWHGPHEADPAAMSDDEKRANESVAAWLFKDWLKGRKGARTLDIGAAFPWLAHSLAKLGCDATAIDGEPHGFGGMLCHLYSRDFDLDGAPLGPPFDLISAIHTFEHLYDPVGALRKMRDAVDDYGYIYLRMPDHSVPGFERDLAPGHYAIHPFYHCLDSLLQCLVELGDRSFEVAATFPIVPGQRDTFLRPISKGPKLGLAMIVKNEARDLPKCLDSIAPIIDAAVVMDTGSTDGTKKIAADLLADVPSVLVDNYFDASEKTSDGNWQLWDFAKARNWALEGVEAYRPDWVTWMDGDDELLTPSAYLRAMRRGDVDVFATTVESDGQKWMHQRLWRASARVRFKGRCHEWPVIDGLRGDVLRATVRHNVAPDASQEDANARNLRLLMREWQEGPTERGSFYIANTHRDGGRHAEAVEWYRKRLAYGQDSFRDEWLFAWLYMCRSLRRTIDEGLADPSLAAAQIEAPDWCEFTMERAAIAYDAKRYSDAIAHAIKCVDREPKPTLLWREPHLYRDGPCRLISWCHEHMGKIGKAALWAVLAQDRIGQPDAEWDARVASLKARVILRAVVSPKKLAAPAIVTRRRERIALVRHGAIGDVLMTLNLLPAFKEANPGAEITYHTRVEGINEIIKQAGADRVITGAAPPHEADGYSRIINLVGYPLDEGYPDKPMRYHLLHYFAEEMGINTSDALDWAPPALELPLPKRPKWAPDMPYISLQAETGWSKYKEWNSDKWGEVIAALSRALPNGVFICHIALWRDKPLSECIAAIANARMHLGVDSFGNHLTNYFWKHGNGARRVPGVILWGSTQMEAAGYPSNTNIGHRLPCGPCFRENPSISQMPRGLCVDPPGQTRHDEGVHACMASITVDEVVEAALKTWEAAK